MKKLPPDQTPLNQHSLEAIEIWLEQLGAHRQQNDRASWDLVNAQWSALIQLEQDNLKVSWNKEGKANFHFFSYSLPRYDVDAAIKMGP